MQNPFDTFHPAGFHTLNAYLFVDEPAELIEFLKKPFMPESLPGLSMRGSFLTALYKLATQV